MILSATGADGAPGRVPPGARHGLPLILSTGSWSLQGFINRMFLVWHSPESLAAAMPGGHGQLRHPQPVHRHRRVREHVRGPVPRRGPGRQGRRDPVAVGAHRALRRAGQPGPDTGRTGLLRLGGARPCRSGRGSHPVSDPLPLRGAGGDGFRLFRDAFGSRAEHAGHGDHAGRDRRQHPPGLPPRSSVTRGSPRWGSGEQGGRVSSPGACSWSRTRSWFSAAVSARGTGR